MPPRVAQYAAVDSSVNGREKTESEMTSISEGKRTFNWPWEDDLEECPGRIWLVLTATGTEPMKVNRATLGATHGYYRNRSNFDSLQLETATFQEAPGFAGVAGGFEMPGRHERRRASPLSGRVENARAPGEVRRSTEAFQGQSPFLCPGVFGFRIFRPLLGCEPEAGNTVELGTDLVIDAIRNEYRNMIDQAV